MSSNFARLIAAKLPGFFAGVNYQFTTIRNVSLRLQNQICFCNAFDALSVVRGVWCVS